MSWSKWEQQKELARCASTNHQPEYGNFDVVQQFAHAPYPR
jgi:hypothetical protein